MDWLDVLSLPGDAGMPGRSRWLAWCSAALAVAAAVLAVALVLRPARACLLLPVPTAEIIVLCVSPVVARLRLNALLQGDAVAAGPAVLGAVRASGVRRVSVRLGRVAGIARSFRAGRDAVVLAHDLLPRRPGCARFMVAHELGHVARHDGLRRRVTVGSAVCCWWALAILWVPAFVLGAAGFVAGIAWFNRSMELDCDRLAVRWVGADAAEEALSMIAEARRQTPRNPVRAVRSWLTYPSVDRRRAALSAGR